ncbi:MAG: Rnf-Nqr domain containing protein [Ruthenibacterium sp.]
MTNEERRRSEELRRKIKRDRVFLNNPVVMQGLGLAPLVVAATSLKNAVILGVTVLLLLTLTRILAAMLSRFSYFRFRGLTYAFSSALIYVGVRWCGAAVPATDIAPLGLYLPLLVADPIILKRYERPQRERGHGPAQGHHYQHWLCAGDADCGCDARADGAGTLYGVVVFQQPILPIATLPSGGFIFLAVLVALWRGFVTAAKHQLGVEEG